jgi:hypothetical protein
VVSAIQHSPKKAEQWLMTIDNIMSDQ